MKHFLLNSGPDKNGIIRLSGSDYHYLARVRRLAPGEFFPALLPDGEETLVQVRSIDGGTLEGVCTGPGEMRKEYDFSGAQPNPYTARVTPIILLQALPKGEKMDLIVRQAAEGGIARIVPFVSEFSIPKLKGEDAATQKTARWERIIKEARQQSGSPTATAIQPPLSIDGLFQWWERFKQERPKARGLLFHHLPLAQASLHGYLESDPEAVVLAIGPEGGFSPAETSLFLEAGFKPFTIGDTILRTETAALYCAAAVRIILLERNSWETKQARPVNG